MLQSDINTWRYQRSKRWKNKKRPNRKTYLLFLTSKENWIFLIGHNTVQLPIFSVEMQYYRYHHLHDNKLCKKLRQELCMVYLLSCEKWQQNHISSQLEVDWGHYWCNNCPTKALDIFNNVWIFQNPRKWKMCARNSRSLEGDKSVSSIQIFLAYNLERVVHNLWIHILNK